MVSHGRDLLCAFRNRSPGCSRGHGSGKGSFPTTSTTARRCGGRAESSGGNAKAQEVNRRLAPLVDVLFGNEEDFTAAFGFSVAGLDEHHAKLDPSNFRRMIETVVQEFPGLAVVATTLRHAKTATLNDWGGSVLLGWPLLPCANTRKSGNLRPRGRRRFFCLRIDLRIPVRQGSSVGRGVWSSTRCARDDHAWRYLDGHSRRGSASDEGTNGSDCALSIYSRRDSRPKHT